jgi:hypothetical protein
VRAALILIIVLIRQTPVGYRELKLTKDLASGSILFQSRIGLTVGDIEARPLSSPYNMQASVIMESVIGTVHVIEPIQFVPKIGGDRLALRSKLTLLHTPHPLYHSR